MSNIKLNISFNIANWNISDEEVKPVEGWDVGFYKFGLSKTFIFDNKEEAYKKAEQLRVENWKTKRIGENIVKEFSIAMYENESMQSCYFTHFKPR